MNLSFFNINKKRPPKISPENEPNIKANHTPTGPRNEPIMARSSMSPIPNPSRLVNVLNKNAIIHKSPYPKMAPIKLCIVEIYVNPKYEAISPSGMSQNVQICGITIAWKSVRVATIKADKNIKNIKKEK